MILKLTSRIGFAKFAHPIAGVLTPDSLIAHRLESTFDSLSSRETQDRIFFDNLVCICFDQLSRSCQWYKTTAETSVFICIPNMLTYVIKVHRNNLLIQRKLYYSTELGCVSLK